MGRNGEEKRAKYLYCIIKERGERAFPDLQAIGGRGDPVHTVPFEALACVVSDSPDVRYDCTRANLMAHEMVIEQVMREHTVLPIRFGTVTRAGALSPEEDIRRKLLQGHYDQLLGLHQEMEGRVELGLKALWREERAIFAELVAENGDIRSLRQRLLGRSPQAAHYDRMRLGEMVKAALELKREREAKSLLASLRPIAERVRENKTLMDRMVLNVAFLVRQEREGDFDQAVRRLDQELSGRMVLKYTAPSPPFNFCEVVVTWEEEGAGVARRGQVAR